MESKKLGKGLNTLLDSIYQPIIDNTSNPPTGNLFEEMNTLSLNKGMSKRFYAACAAMQGIVSSNECGIAHNPETVVKWAYALADELLKQENL